MSLSKETLNELHKNYNPDNSPLRIYQLRLVEILKYFDSVCKANNIRYWLNGGSCIGAIRHKGFIPWDDDIDVAMLREDYDRLVSVFSETDDYVLQTYKNDSHYVCTYAKVRDKKTWILESVHTSKYRYCGAFIDVFIIEKGIPWMGKATSYLTYLLDGVDQKNPSNVVRDSIFHICKPLFFGVISILQSISKKMRSSRLMISYGSPFWSQEYYIEDISEVEYREFEGLLFPVPQGWDHFLTMIYGDYMSLPDLNKVKGELHVKEIRYL